MPFMLWLGEVIINAKATLAFQMLLFFLSFFLFIWNKQTSDDHLSSISMMNSKWKRYFASDKITRHLPSSAAAAF